MQISNACCFVKYKTEKVPVDALGPSTAGAEVADFTEELNQNFEPRRSDDGVVDDVSQDSTVVY